MLSQLNLFFKLIFRAKACKIVYTVHIYSIYAYYYIETIKGVVLKKNYKNGDISNINSYDNYKLLLSQLPIGVIILNSDLVLVEVNDFMFRYFNKNREEIIGKRFGDLFNCNIAATDKINCGMSNGCDKCIINNYKSLLTNSDNEIKDIEFEYNFTLNNRISIKWFLINVDCIIKGNDEFFVIVFTDITNRKIAENELMELGITDELTGLYNRRYIFKQFKKVLESEQKSIFPVCLALLDIDKFKDVNDKFGHTTGDQVLIGLAGLFKRFTRGTDYAGRYGGDEFLIQFKNTDIAKAKVILTRISKKFSEIMKGKIDLPLTLSAGLIEIQNEDVKNSELVFYIDQVDKLLYKAKAAGRNNIEANKYHANKLVKEK